MDAEAGERLSEVADGWVMGGCAEKCTEEGRMAGWTDEWFEWRVDDGWMSRWNRWMDGWMDDRWVGG